ncbi:ATP synthase protein I [Chromohalobacter marismortui]|uniref:ATP synthase protein I n=1 Tax=Chromohalobacter marismortui TaxID=42055 RepID=A0A4R7NNR5_9GAMM|nr:MULTISPECIES: ATP synthase subunit I [Chromohalobacter]MCI0509489.1 ATP synthase subunit I [Chromohalobacter sp.]MCI0592617.1 ATP synthase subunit I [Chromohalobacter sp.]TDU22209.1 ATP synthase protein I [Chromohalobacter marismortui]
MHKAAPARLKGPRLFPLLMLQLMIVLGMAVLAFIWHAPGTALSTLLGGGVAWMPSVLFAWLTFRYRGASQARNIVKSFYRAEAGKFGLTAALFIVVFVAVPPSNPAFFFGAYVVTQLAHWLGPWLLHRPSRT